MLVNMILGAVITLLPFYLRITKVPFNRECKQILLLNLLLILIVLLPNKKRGVNYFLFLPLVLLAVFNQWSVSSLNVVMTTFSFMIGGIFCIRYYESYDETSTQHLFDGMIFGSILQGIMGISGYFGYELYPPFMGMAGSVPHLNTVGSIGETNSFSSYLAITIPAFMTRKNLAWLLPIPLYALLLCQSWMGIASFFAGVVYYINYKYSLISKGKVFLLVTLGMAILPFFDIGIDSARFIVWRRIVSQASLKHWLIGEGPGWFVDSRMPIGAEIFSMEHNSYLTLFNTFGMFGVLFFLYFIYKWAKTKDRNIFISTLFFIIFCNSWGHFSIQQPVTIAIMIPVICFCLGEINGNESSRI